MKKERTRTLARRSTALIWYLFLLPTLIGILLGMAGGKLLHGFVVTTCEVDMMMFGHLIKPVSYLYSGLLTVLFAVMVGVMMHFKLKKIDMVESLKSIE